MKRCRCSCGGQLAALDGEEAVAVEQHNRAPRHTAWRHRRERTDDNEALAWNVLREWLRGTAA